MDFKRLSLKSKFAELYPEYTLEQIQLSEREGICAFLYKHTKTPRILHYLKFFALTEEGKKTIYISAGVCDQDPTDIDLSRPMFTPALIDPDRVMPLYQMYIHKYHPTP